MNNNTHRPSYSNNKMVGGQFEYESPSVAFWASCCYIMEAHKTRVEQWVMLCNTLIGIINIVAPHDPLVVAMAMGTPKSTWNWDFFAHMGMIFHPH